MSSTQRSGVPAGRGFETTHWTIIRACAGTEIGAHSALSELCRIYWHPVYAYLALPGAVAPRRAGPGAALFPGFPGCQGTPWALRVDQGQGRFRSYLLTSLRNFVCSEATRERAIKRGGQLQIVALETLLPEEPLPSANASGVDVRYDRDWAVALTDAALKAFGGRVRRPAQIAPCSACSKPT